MYLSTGIRARQAFEKSDEAAVKLKTTIEKIVERTKSEDILEVQKIWNEFCEAEAKRIASQWTGGTMYPLIYHTAVEQITRARTFQLNDWMEEELSNT
jgi:uncharacterized protein YecT (DUF1311 family)